MDDLKNNKLFWVLMAVTLLNVGTFFVSKVVVDKAADRVIQKLQKDYSPSPYGPGLDPDKVAPDALKSSKTFFTGRSSQVSFDEKERSHERWREEWERNRQ